MCRFLINVPAYANVNYRGNITLTTVDDGSQLSRSEIEMVHRRPRTSKSEIVQKDKMPTDIFLC